MKTKIFLLMALLLIAYPVTPPISCLNVLNSLEISWAAREIVISYPYAYIRCSGAQEIILLDISNPVAPYFITSMKIGDGYAEGLHVEGSLV